MASENPSDLQKLVEELEDETYVIGKPSLEEVRRRLRQLRPNARGPRPTPRPISERKRRRRAARDARKLNRG